MEFATGIHLIIFLEIVGVARGLQCHVCNYISATSDQSTSDYYCKEGPIPTKFLKNCSEVHPLAFPASNFTYNCIKTYIEEKGRLNVKRACGITNMKDVEIGAMGGMHHKTKYNYCKELELGKHTTGKQCQCDTDGCNGSSHFFPSFLNSWGYAFTVLIYSLITFVTNVEFLK